MAQAQKRDPRGRKTNPRGKILSNGLFKSQWEQILKDARQVGKEGAPFLREVIDLYCGELLHSEAISQGKPPIEILRVALEWYVEAKSQQEGRYSTEPEFKKLSKTKSKEK